MQIYFHFIFQYDLKQHLAWEKRMRASNLARNNIMLQRRNSINSGLTKVLKYTWAIQHNDIEENTQQS